MYGNAIYPVHVVVLSTVSLQLSPSEQDDSNNYICKNNNWINNRSTWTWYLTPSIGSVGADRAWDILYNGSFGDTSTRFNFSVYPSIYLKNNVIIESGTGTSDNPYILKAGS